jgi:DNA gyrase subunit A
VPDLIEPVSLAEETRRRYLNYALSVITSRALPDVRDGLKPVQRRILYNMYHDLHLASDGRAAKCARVCGDVMGNYHPHGDAAIYDALVRMAQPFVLRYPLVHGEGNFGSVDGLEPASFRYTECKLTPIAEELLHELRQRTVDLRPNYDGTRQEPVVLPARYPNLLVNGVAGIAVGMATNIPPHNLGEVVRAALLLLDNPQATTAQLLERIKGPDFPLGGRVLADRKTLRSIYEEGVGSVKVQGEWKLEEQGRKRSIVITSIPYGVSRAAVEESIGTLIVERKLPQLVNLIGESNEKEGTRIVLEIKADADPEVVMAYLYKHTPLQQNFAYNMTCLVPAEEPPGKLVPRRLGLRDILSFFLDFRLQTVRRRFQYQLEQLRSRIHILEGFRAIFQDLDKALRLIRESQGKADAAQRLQKAFRLDAEQADAILEMLLYRLAQLEIKNLLQELKEKREQARNIEEILASERKLRGVVKQELQEIADKYGDRRRTRIVAEDELPHFDPDAYIVRENTHVVVTRDGWIKRVNRLAGVDSTRVREGDAVLAVVPGSTLEQVVFFSDDGIAYTMRIHEVPASSGYGEPISKFFRLGEGARIVQAIGTDPRFTPPDGSGDPPPPYLVVVTALGQTLRTSFAPYRTASTVRGRQYVRLAEQDRVVFVALLRDERSVMLASVRGHVIHFPLEQIALLSGVGKGAMGIKLDADDRCLGAALIRNQNDALVVETSGGKRIEFYGSRELTHRGGRGFQAVKRTTFVRVVPPPPMPVNWDECDSQPA